MSDLYIGAMGMVSSMNKLKVQSNNIANMETIGYKSDTPTSKVFEEQYRIRKESDEPGVLGIDEDQMYIDDVSTSFSEGVFKQTGGQFDFALHDDSGSGDVSFFTVQKDGQTYYTRNGQFVLDGERHLTTANGAYVLDQNGKQITIPQWTGGDVGIMADKNGTIFSYNPDNGQKQAIAKLQLQTVGKEDLGLLEKKFGSFFQPTTVEKLTQDYGSIQNILNQFDTNVTVKGVFKHKEALQEALKTGQLAIFKPFEGQMEKGMLEASNVDMASEMVKMLEINREFQMNQKVVSTYSRVLEKDANEVGR